MFVSKQPSKQLILSLWLHVLKEAHMLSAWPLLFYNFIIHSGLFLLLSPFPSFVPWYYFYIKWEERSFSVLWQGMATQQLSLFACNSVLMFGKMLAFLKGNCHSRWISPPRSRREFFPHSIEKQTHIDFHILAAFTSAAIPIHSSFIRKTCRR